VTGVTCAFFNPFRTTENLIDLGTDSHQLIRPVLDPLQNSNTGPIQWLKENSDNKHALALSTGLLPHLQVGRPRAALISLVRNTELEGMIQSIQQLERKWNENYQVSRRILTKLNV